MTQLPSPGHPPASPVPATYAPAHVAQEHYTYGAAPTVPVEGVTLPYAEGSIGGGGAPVAVASLERRAGAHGSQTTPYYPGGPAGSSQSTYGAAVIASRAPSLPPLPSMPPPARQPAHPHLAQPRRAATLPAAPAVHPVAASLPLAPSDALAAHHRSLVAYYWHYAQQGYAAPLTAPDGTAERAQQDRARTEAVDWARTCGLRVVDPTAPTHVAGGPGVPHAVASPEPAKVRTLSRPLPAAPTGGAAGPPGGPPGGPPAGGSGRPLPSPAGPPASASAPSTTVSAPPYSTRSPLPAVPSRSGRAASMADPSALSPAPPLPAIHDASAHSAGPIESTPATLHKRPLPLPPLAQLVADLDGMSISAPSTGRTGEAPPAIPSIAVPDEQSAESPQPPIPTFSFGGGDGEGDDEPPSSAPAVPTFSFGGPDDDEDRSATSSGPQPSPARCSAPLHPRHDPSHPSHKLYHPTSVLPSSPAGPTSTSASSLPEAGTLTCTACRALIFGRVLVALGREWHPDCFRCADESCGARLEVMEFEGTPEDWEDAEEGHVKAENEGEDEGGPEKPESLRGKAWCMVHFEERFALECYHCRTPIASASYLPIADPLLPPRAEYRHPSTRFYHPLHFFCSGCGDPFVDPVSFELLPSTSDLEARPYLAREGHPYCDACDLRMWRPKCVGCRKGLREEDGFLEVEGAKWHEGCFKCSMCAKPLSGIYLLRRDPQPAPSTTRTGDVTHDDDDANELPFCAECYDVKAEEKAGPALAAR